MSSVVVKGGASKSPTLSVCVVTYNHEAYLRDCLESIVQQAVNFDYEIIIGDDASTDHTREIIHEFKARYPSVVKAVLHECNIGSTANYTAVHAAAKGKYIAHVDGDDLMLPGKLQCQVDYLEAHPRCNVVWHQVTFFNEAGDTCIMPSLASSVLNVELYTRDLMLCGSVAAHSSTMYRAEKFFLHGPSTEELIDWYILVRLVDDGYGIVLNANLGKYRLHAGGLSSGAKATFKMRRFFCDSQLKILRLHPEYSREVAACSLMTTLLDAVFLRKSFVLSLKVFLRARSLPRLRDILKLKGLYLANRRPV